MSSIKVDSEVSIQQSRRRGSSNCSYSNNNNKVDQKDFFRSLNSSTRKDDKKKIKSFGKLLFYKNEKPVQSALHERHFVKLGRNLNETEKAKKAHRSRLHNQDKNRPIISFPPIAGVVNEEDNDNIYTSHSKNGNIHLENVWNLLTKQYLWNRPKPDLVVSVTGDASDMNKKVQGAKFKFKWGKELRYVVKNSDSWVITGGTDAGVMQQTGELLRAPDHIMDTENDTTIIGIAVWDKIEHFKNFEKDKTSVTKPIFLNKDHSHFLLIDDEDGNWGTEVNFRTDLEQYFHEDCNIPIVCISIGGGPGTLSTIANSLKKNTPVILVKGSSRITELLIDYHKNKKLEKAKLEKEKMQIDNYKDLESILKEKYEVKSFPEKKFDDWEECKKHLDSEMIQVYDPADDSHESLDKLILKALDRDIHKQKFIEKKFSTQHWRSAMRLAVDFDDFKIGKRLLTYKNDIELVDLPLQLALSKNRVDFVKLFLEQEAKIRQGDEEFKDYELKGVNLPELYRTVDPRSVLYKMLFKINSKFKEEITVETMIDLYKDFMGKKAKTLHNYLSRNFTTNEEMQSESSNCRRNSKLSQEEIIENPSGKKVSMTRADDVFIWAIALIRCDLALAIWERVENPLACLLFACRVLKVVRHKIHPLDEIYEETVNARRTMEELAVKFINLCGAVDERNAQLLIVRQLEPFANQSPLMLARMAHHRAFIVSDTCKQVIEGVWRGPCKTEFGSMKIFFLSFLAPFIFPLFLAVKYIKDKQFTKLTDRDAVLLKAKMMIENGTTENLTKNNLAMDVWRFYNTPIVTMFWTLIYFLTFLFIFSTTLLTLYDRDVWFYVLFAFVTTFLFEEILQAIREKISGRGIFKYFSDTWNICDMIGITLFYCGFGLRMGGIEWARVFLGFSICAFILKILHFFTLHATLGPQIVTIGRMLADLGFFLIILITIILAYTIGTHAMLYTKPGWDGIRVQTLLLRPYFQMFGELFLDDIRGDNETLQRCKAGDDLQATDCPSEYGRQLVPWLLGVYIVITNVLLLNLLIAQFSYTFSQVQQNSRDHYYYGRFRTIVDYHDRGALFPPVSIILFIMYLFKYSSASHPFALNLNSFKNASKTEDIDRNEILNSWNIQLSLWEDDVRDRQVKEWKTRRVEKQSQITFKRSQTIIDTHETESKV